MYVREQHAKIVDCNELNPQPGERDDGTQYLYCRNCRVIFLEWGGQPDRPQVVQRGLEPEYDCPECDYYKTGVSTGPHEFQAHLVNDHSYTEDEARSYRHNQ